MGECQEGSKQHSKDDLAKFGYDRFSCKQVGDDTASHESPYIPVGSKYFLIPQIDASVLDTLTS